MAPGGDIGHIPLLFIVKQDKFLTIAEALRAAVLSLLRDEDMRYEQSFYYWAAFISHGFASVQLDEKLLGQIHARLEQL